MSELLEFQYTLLSKNALFNTAETYLKHLLTHNSYLIFCETPLKFYQNIKD